MLVKIVCFKYLRKLIHTALLIICLTGIFACESKSKDKDLKINKTGNSLPVINIGRLICGGHLPLAIVEKKYQNHLKTFRIHPVQNHDWNDVVTDMKSGKLAGTFILSPLAMNLIRNGFPGKIVLMANRNGNGFVLSKKIRTIADLKNRKSIIAVPHIYSQQHVLLHTLLQRHGISKANIKILGMPPRDMINSMRNGEIDGFVVGEPESNKSVSIGVGWMASISPAIWKNHMDHVFLASDVFIKEQPKNLQELITQLVRSGQFIENNASAAAVMGEDYTGTKAEIFSKVLTTPSLWISYTNMVASKHDLISMAQKLVEMKLWTKIPDNINSGYFDMRFVKKAEQKIRNQ